MPLEIVLFALSQSLVILALVPYVSILPIRMLTRMVRCKCQMFRYHTKWLIC